MWVGIVGSRDWADLNQVANVVNGLSPDDVVVSGDGGQVDKFAVRRAQFLNLATCVFPAQWDRHGKAAGPFRNSKIVNVLSAHDGCLVAFHDGVSKGTADTIAKARAAGIPVRVITPKPLIG